MRKKMRRFGMGLTLTLLLPMATWAADLDRLLLEAESSRSTDPARFGELLGRLEAQPIKADSEQQRRLRLLQNYRKVMRGDYGAAIGDAIALFDQAPEVDIKFRAGLLVANTAAITRDFTLGLRYLERALALQSQIPDRETRQVGYGVAAILYNQYGQYALASHYADRLLSDQPSNRNRCFGRQLRIEALHGLGRAIDEDGDIQAALSDCAAQAEAIPTNLIRAVLAQRWAAAGKRHQAIALLEASRREVEATGYSRLIGEIYGLLAQYRFEVGDIAAAESHANHVVRLEGQDPRWLPLVTAHHVLYQIALQRGDVDRALTEYRLYAEADKARLDDIKAREYAFQLSRHELNQKNQSIQLLSNQNQVLRLKQEVAERSSWNFRLAIALLLVITASAAYWGWRARRMHRNLHQLANTDGLTGLSNRRHFRARSESMLALCAQRRRPVSVLLFDLDHFKQINDQCGHSSGDWVLREVAKVGRQHCREGDLFGRIGGEEFAMTLIDCDMDAALRIADQCRRSIEGIDAAKGAGCALPVAASIGVVSTSMSGYDYETLIAHADAAMYRSKVAGRNRVSLYQPPPVPENGQSATLDSRNATAMLREY